VHNDRLNDSVDRSYGTLMRRDWGLSFFPALATGGALEAPCVVIVGRLPLTISGSSSHDVLCWISSAIMLLCVLYQVYRTFPDSNFFFLEQIYLPLDNRLPDTLSTQVVLLA
jgi:hypothetical protein